MNRFFKFISCAFVGMAATLVSSCSPRYFLFSEPTPPPLMAPLPSAGLAYESGSAAGLHYGPLIEAQYGYYGPPPGPYYGAPPPPGPYYGPPPAADYGPPPGPYYGTPPDQYYGPPPGGG
jgi:hypothetical protein